MTPENTFLAVDLHQHCGVALFDRNSGRLLAYGRVAHPSEQDLRLAAGEVLGAGDSVHWLFSAGAPAAQAVWERAAMREGVRVQRVGQPDWQQELLVGAPHGDGQKETQALAMQALAEAGLPPARLSSAEARAICVGLWAGQQLAKLAGVHAVRIRGQVALAPKAAQSLPVRRSKSGLARVA